MVRTEYDSMLLDILNSGRDDYFHVGYLASAVIRSQIPPSHHNVALLGLAATLILSDFAHVGVFRVDGFHRWEGTAGDWLEQINEYCQGHSVTQLLHDRVIWFQNTPSGDSIGEHFADDASDDSS